MSAESFRIMVTYLEAFGAGAIIAGIAVWWILKSFLPSYIAEKAKNLATREDIGRITDEIEKVKVQYAEALQNIIHQNNLFLEEVKGHHQLRMAAMDRRLQACQDAFTNWVLLMTNLRNDKFEIVFQECREWWNKNCIYLSPDVRATFIKAVNSAYHLLEIEKIHPKTPEFLNEIKETTLFLFGVGEVIEKGAELPPIGIEELGFPKNA